MKHADFSVLTDDTSHARPGYATSVLDAVLARVGRPAHEIDFVDVCAGSGIWTRMVAARDVRSVTAVESHRNQRARGISDSLEFPITWHSGTAEATGLRRNDADFLSIASGFHRADFELATAEALRVLRPGGLFAALWNPRVVDGNPLLIEIKEMLSMLAPELERISMGRALRIDSIGERLAEHPGFEDFMTVEGRHVVWQSPEQVLASWRSLGDVRQELGTERFETFIEWMEDRVVHLGAIETTYVTRCFLARARTSI
jgi:ubiquinone/menaquinone biosynthesis C-methylase UbiE